MLANHSLNYQNVVSKYYSFLPENIEEAFLDLSNIITEQGYQPAGNYFFSLLSDPTDEIMMAEVFMTIEEDKAEFNEEDEVRFRTYFNIKPMLMTRLTKNFEVESQEKYWDLFRYLRLNNLREQTPIFVEIKMNYLGENFLEMSIGYHKMNSSSTYEQNV